MPKIRERGYFLLLAALLLLVVIYPIVHETEQSKEVLNVLRSVVLLAALHVLFSQRRHLFIGYVLAVLLLASVWIGYLLPDRRHLPIVLAFHLVATLFFALSIGSILMGVYQQTSVTANNIAGALCVYLLIGVVFGHIYWFIQTTAPGSFHGEGELGEELRDPDRSHFAMTYYSLVTLASVGANDVVPARAAARGMTMLEAICGQFYLVVLIADLIGKRVGQPPAKDRAPPN
jgi:voltage-gated potassium channel